MKKFGLLHKATNIILSLEKFEAPEDADASDSYSLNLNEDGDNQNMWAVSSAHLANLVRTNQQNHHCTESQYPAHRFNPEELEVVEIIVNSNQVKVPEYTYEQYLNDSIKFYQNQKGLESQVMMLERHLNSYKKDQQKMSPTQLAKNYIIPIYSLKEIKPEWFK